jgi:hypothetical protein
VQRARKEVKGVNRVVYDVTNQAPDSAYALSSRFFLGCFSDEWNGPFNDRVLSGFFTSIDCAIEIRQTYST